jgi:hypothetical protein
MAGPTLVVPHNIEAERVVIGCLALEPHLIKDTLLSTADFYSKELAEYYEALVEMYENGEPIDLVTLPIKLGEQAAFKISEFMDRVGSTANFHYYERMVQNLAIKRKAQRDLYELAVNIEEVESGEVRSCLSQTIEDFSSNGRKSGPLGDVSRWVSVTEGYFNITDCYGALKASGKKERGAIRQAIHRMAKEGTLEKYGDKDGQYRRIQSEADAINWREASTEDLAIKYPFRIERLAKTFPGNIIVVAGAPQSGKTSFALEFTRINMHTQPLEIHYYSSEMGESEFRVRIELFENCKPDDWKFYPWERTRDFADIIRPNAINIIDYLEMTTDFWKVAEALLQIHKKLIGGKGIALVGLQKDPTRKGQPMREYGRGGSFSLEKPRLYIALDNGIVKIVKAKNWRGKDNPNGLYKTFKLIQGWDFMETSEWMSEEDERKEG